MHYLVDQGLRHFHDRLREAEDGHGEIEPRPRIVEKQADSKDAQAAKPRRENAAQPRQGLGTGRPARMAIASHDKPPKRRIKNTRPRAGFSLCRHRRRSNPIPAPTIFSRAGSVTDHGDMAYLERHRAAARGRDDAASRRPFRDLCGAQLLPTVERTQRHHGRPRRTRPLLDLRPRRGLSRRHAAHAGRARRARARRVPRRSHARLCDIHPVSDRSMAMRAGIAWLGKNTNVISPRVRLLDLPGRTADHSRAAADEPLETLCAGCTKCIDACPTGALDTPFVLDARRCISYLTIEKRGEIDPELASKHRRRRLRLRHLPERVPVQSCGHRVGRVPSRRSQRAGRHAAR